MATQVSTRKVLTNTKTDEVKAKIGYRISCCKNCIRKDFYDSLCRLHGIEICSWATCHDWLSYAEGMKGDVPIPGHHPEREGHENP